MFTKPVRPFKAEPLSYYNRQLFEILYLRKIMHDENIHIDLNDYTDTYIEEDEEVASICMSSLCYEIMTTLFPEMQQVYVDRDCSTTLIFQEDYIERYYSNLALIEKLFGESKANYYKEGYRRASYIDNINSYCYTVRLIKRKKTGFINRMEVNTSPEFDLDFDLLLAVKMIMDYMNQAAQEMDEIIKQFESQKAG